MKIMVADSLTMYYTTFPGNIAFSRQKGLLKYFDQSWVAVIYISPRPNEIAWQLLVPWISWI